MYKIVSDGILVDDDDFDIEHILTCGQTFAYLKEGNDFVVFPADKIARVSKIDGGYKIQTTNVDFFVNFFDLERDYSKIKQQLGSYEIMRQPIEFGKGIRILKQEPFETLISFIISANNNIKRIGLILSRLRERLGEPIGAGYAFPTYEKLLSQNQQFFEEIGAGYRAKYLYQALRQVTGQQLQQWQALSTEDLRQNLLGVAGVGPKVADCVMLFGYGRGDVFPVDTWIAQMYNQFYQQENNRAVMRRRLTEQFGQLSGYAQQYLFFYQRSGLLK